MKEILRSLYDIKISITGGTHFDVIKRLIRDITRVGQNPSELICSIAETVFPMYKIFIEPDLNFTSIKINNTYNPFQDIQDPLYILNIKKILTIDQIKEKISDKHVKEKIEENLDIYMYMPNDNTKSFNNWIRIRQNLKDYKYYLMFSEWESDDIFIKSPQIEFEVNVKIIGCLISLGYVICFNVNRTSNIFYYTKGLFEGSYISVDNFPSLQLTNIQINGNKKEIIQKIGIDLDLQDNYHQIPCIDLLLKRIN
jgi:adenylate cyclase class IV